MNEQIYIQVCKLYFRAGATMKDIRDILGDDTLINYQHLANGGRIGFKTAHEVVSAIIDCEMKSHKQANA